MVTSGAGSVMAALLLVSVRAAISCLDREGIRRVFQPSRKYHTIQALKLCIPAVAMWRASMQTVRDIPDDVRQRRELPVVRFWDFNPKCLMHTDEEVEVVEGINRVVPQ
jgi:hypothetical protein